MNTIGIFTSNSDEYATPQHVFDALDAEFHFNLDPCATSENHKCEKYYTKSDDGLTKNWGGAEYSVIHLIAKFQRGLKRLIEKHEQIIRLL